MPQYPDNSDAYRNKSTLNGNMPKTNPTSEEDFGPSIMAQPAIPKKRSRFALLFLKEDAKSVLDYIVDDIVVPTLRKLLVSMISNGANMMIYGNRPSYDDNILNFRSSRTSIEPYADRDYRKPKRQMESSYPYRGVIFPTPAKAEEARRRMRDQISKRGYVSVAFLYHLADWDYDPIDKDYGWFNINNAEVIPVRDGYWLKLPGATELI